MMDGLCFTPGVNEFCSSNLPFINGNDPVRAHSTQVSTLGRSGNGVSVENSVVSTSTTQPQKSRFSFTRPLLKSLWLSSNVENREEEEEEERTEAMDNNGGKVEGNTGEEENEMNRTSWVLKILHAQSVWKEEEDNENGIDVFGRENDQRVVVDDENDCSLCNDEDVCEVDEEDGNNEKVEFNKDSFSKLLQKVSLAEAQALAKISYLGNLAYSIPKIKAANLLKRHKLWFVTSSVEKEAHPANVEDKSGSPQVEETEKLADGLEETEEQRKNRYQISASAAYHIAASAASYLQSHTRGILSFKSSMDGKDEDSIGEDFDSKGNAEVRSSKAAPFVATSDSVTAGVSAKEETKRAVAKDLNSAHSSPCAWFICDDNRSATRFFVIQGSESMASWQANLLFEPVRFEGLDVLVHRGIYEAAKGIYEQMLPEVHSHLKSHGDSARLRFTGHSLGGSLALLVNLMLLIRREAPLSSLLPVVMFGAPSILCGGDQLLRRLGLPRRHVKAITMHRDIVPRAFSCSYPDRVAELLRAVNGNFRNHPCLKNRKMLYTPMGEILILQPEEKFSPHHELLPSGSGLYLLSCPLSHLKDKEKQLRAAQAVFFNSPHPLEILSDRATYGSDGTIYRDHDMYSYLRSILGVIRLELNQIRKVKRKNRREVWWPIVTPRETPNSGIVGHQVASSPMSRQPLNFAGAFQTGGQSLKRCSRLVASQHMQLFVILMIPARMLLVGLYHVTS
ncbi:hypothetical protein MKX01_025260 [Papaver californicum]|nr:hypothetical protein MKX01_025260 [Papaver californicum]